MQALAESTQKRLYCRMSQRDTNFNVHWVNAERIFTDSQLVFQVSAWISKRMLNQRGTNFRISSLTASTRNYICHRLRHAERILSQTESTSNKFYRRLSPRRNKSCTFSKDKLRRTEQNSYCIQPTSFFISEPAISELLTSSIHPLSAGSQLYLIYFLRAASHSQLVASHLWAPCNVQEANWNSWSIAANLWDAYQVQSAILARH